MRYEAAARSVCGPVREHNEDNFYFARNWRDPRAPEASTPLTASGHNERALFAICDGMGGESLGQDASYTVASGLRAVEEQISGSEQPAFVRVMLRFTKRMNDTLCQYIRQNKGLRMGTTLSCLMLTRGTVEAFNVGDSPILLLRERRLHWLSKRHTHASRLVEIGVITEEEAKGHPERHRLTQHLGLFPEEQRIEPTRLAPLRLRGGDRFLLCSDGVSDMLGEDEIARLLGAADSAEAACQQLIEAAVAAGGKDNATAIVVFVDELTEQDRAIYAHIADDGELQLGPAREAEGVHRAATRPVAEPRPPAVRDMPRFAEGDHAGSLRLRVETRPGGIRRVPAPAPERPLSDTLSPSPELGASLAGVGGAGAHPTAPGQPAVRLPGALPRPSADVLPGRASGVRQIRDPRRYQLSDDELERFERAREEARMRQMNRGEDAGRPAGQGANAARREQPGVPRAPEETQTYGDPSPQRPPVTVTSVLEEDEPRGRRRRRERPFTRPIYTEPLPPVAADPSYDYALERRPPSAGERIRGILGHLIFFLVFVGIGAGLTWLLFNWSRIARFFMDLLT